MSEAAVIGVDLAKSVFQLHGAAADGRRPSRVSKEALKGAVSCFPGRQAQLPGGGGGLWLVSLLGARVNGNGL